MDVLLVLRHSCCMGSHVLIGAPALLLMLRHSCCVSRHVLIGALALLLVLQHSCCVSRHVLIGASAFLLVLWHSCCVSRHVLIGAPALMLREQARPERCFGTPAGATTLLFYIVPLGTYYTTSYSFLMIGLGSQIDI